MAGAFTINYTGSSGAYTMPYGPSRIITKKGRVAKQTYTDTIGILHISGYARIKRKFTFVWDLIPDSMIDAMEIYIDDAIVNHGVIDFKVTCDMPGYGVQTFTVYVGDDDNEESIYGKDCQVKTWKYSISFIERIGRTVVTSGGV